MLIFGFWGWLAPEWFAEAVRWPLKGHAHFLKDAGVFQIAIGVSLVVSLISRDAITTVLVGYLAGSGLHSVNHLVDIDAGGGSFDWVVFAVLSVLAAVALVARRRHLSARSRTSQRASE